MSDDTINKGLLSPADEVSVKKVIQKFGSHRRHIATRWRFIFAAIAIGAVIGLITSLLTKTVYTAECTFVLEEGDKGGGGLGQYSALASMAGIDVGSSTGLFQSDNITQLYKSRLMVEKTLLTPAMFNNGSQLLINKYIEINKLRKAWNENPKLKDLKFDIPKQRYTIIHDSIINLIVGDINKNYLTVEKPDKKLTLVSVKVKATDQRFAKAFTETIVSNVNSFYVQTKTKKAQQNVVLLQRQADSVRSVVNTSIGRAAFAFDANPNPDPANMQGLRAPSQKRQVDVAASTAIYSEVVRNLEISRAALQRETPLIQVIDQPVLPLLNDRLSKSKAIITGALVAFLLSILWIITKNMYAEIMG